MDLQLFNAVSHVILRGLIISEMNFEICHRIIKDIKHVAQMAMVAGLLVSVQVTEDVTMQPSN